MSDRPEFAYAGFAPCGCLVTLIADMPEHKSMVARECAKVIKDGDRLERLHHSKVTELLETIGIGCHCEKKEEKKDQLSLFDLHTEVLNEK
jgi:hypothetical protein